MSLTLISPEFAGGQTMPRKFTREGENLMPPLEWSGAPEGTESLALIVEDPDAPSGTFRHFCIFNIPGDRDGLPQSVDTGQDNALSYGVNDFGNARYDGPEPPQGHGPHRYFFRLAALDVPSLGVPANLPAAKVWDEVRKHAIEEAELVAVYER